MVSSTLTPMPRLHLLLAASFVFASLPSRGDELLERALAAQRRGPVALQPVDGGVEEAFLPVPLLGARCADGLTLVRDEAGHGSCDGYSNTTVSLSLAYPGEPEATTLGVDGARPGFPVSHERGPDLEVESFQCSNRGFGFRVVTVNGGAPDPEATRRAEEAARKADALAHQQCLARVKAEVAKERRWYRCELLSVDACRREAFLHCRGNTGPRGLLRATWSRPKDRPANETLVVKPVGR